MPILKKHKLQQKIYFNYTLYTYNNKNKVTVLTLGKIESSCQKVFFKKYKYIEYTLDVSNLRIFASSNLMSVD